MDGYASPARTRAPPRHPLYLAKGDAVDLAADQHTLVAGLAALHRDENGVCTECALNYPCATVKLAQVVAGGAV